MELPFDAETSYRITLGELNFEKIFFEKIENSDSFGKGRNGLREQIILGMSHY